VRAEDVIAARDDDGELERAVVGLDDVLGGGLGRGIRVGRLEHVGFDAARILVVGGAIDLIGGDVDEALDAVRLGRLDDHVSTHHVVLREGKRVAERVVDMRLGGSMDDGVDLLGFEDVLQQIGGQDVALDELVVRVVLDLIEVVQGRAVVKLVKVDHLVLRELLDELDDDV